MTVRELKEFLSQFDDDTEVSVVTSLNLWYDTSVSETTFEGRESVDFDFSPAMGRFKGELLLGMRN